MPMLKYGRFTCPLPLSYMPRYNSGINTDLYGCNKMLYRVLDICFDIPAPNQTSGQVERNNVYRFRQSISSIL